MTTPRLDTGTVLGDAVEVVKEGRLLGRSGIVEMVDTSVDFAPDRPIYRLKLDSDSGVVDLAQLTALTQLLLPETLTRRLLQRVEAPGTGIVDARRLTEVLGVCCYGSQQQQARLCFDLFDANRDGDLQPAELLEMLTVITLVGELDSDDYCGLGVARRAEKVAARLKAAKVRCVCVGLMCGSAGALWVCWVSSAPDRHSGCGAASEYRGAP